MKIRLHSILAQLGLIVVLLMLLGLIYIAPFHFLHPETVYYFGIVVIVIGAVFLSVLFMLFFDKAKIFFERVGLKERDFFPCLLVAFFIMYSFHITIPTLIDRSISIYLLNQLDESGGKAPIAKLQDEFLEGYVGGYSVVCRRMAEQIESGNVVHDEDIYSLTPRGKRAIEFLRAFAVLTGVNQYYVKSNDTNLLPYRYIITANGCEAVASKDEKLQ